MVLEIGHRLLPGEQEQVQMQPGEGPFDRDYLRSAPMTPGMDALGNEEHIKIG